jgi:hypothetical protein
MAVRALTDHINQAPGIFLCKARWETENEDDQEESESGPLLLCTTPTGMELSLYSLSSGEMSAVLFDLAIARAEIAAQYRPTILIIESDGLSMSNSFLRQYLDKLASPQVPFQTIVVATDLRMPETWGGWQCVRFSRQNKERGPHSTISVD